VQAESVLPSVMARRATQQATLAAPLRSGARVCRLPPLPVAGILLDTHEAGGESWMGGGADRRCSEGGSGAFSFFLFTQWR